MALSRVFYPGNGSTQNFSLTFPYIDRTHVGVFINGFRLQTYEFEWLSDTVIRIGGAPVTGSTVELRRITPRDHTLVEFQNGAILTQEELNLAKLQQFYLVQEVVDSYESLIEGELIRVGGNGTSVEEMIAGITEQILSSQLANDLQQRIDDINLNAESILEQVARVDGIQAQLDELLTGGGGIATLIADEQAARIEGDTAILHDLELIGARSDDNLGFVLDLSTVRVSPTESLATRLSALAASDGANSAAIVAEQNARASAIGTVTSSITTLNGQYNGLSASLQTVQSVVTGPGGLTAQYMVKTDVNGYVSGFGLYNNGATSDFTVVADRFAIIQPGSTSKIVPFAVVGGVVYIKDAVIQNLTISKLTQGNLNADMNVGTGRIIWSNGVFMKVAGVGFGSTNQFIEWFGPVMALTSCTEANGKSWLKTNGDAYFGGTLRSGTLRFSETSLSTSASASVTLPNVVTNGGTRTITYEYSYSKSAQRANSNYPDLGGGSGSSGGATIYLYRTLSGGSEELIDSFSVTNFYTWAQDGGVREESESMGGSKTFVDNSGGLTTRSYRVAIASRTTWVTLAASVVTTQSLKVTSQE